MQGIVLRTLIIMLGLFLASVLVPGVSISGAWTFIFAAVLLGVVNAVVRPIAFVLTLTITLVTLGLFLFVLNAAMFALVAAMPARPPLKDVLAAFGGDLDALGALVNGPLKGNAAALAQKIFNRIRAFVVDDGFRDIAHLVALAANHRLDTGLID